MNVCVYVYTEIYYYFFIHGGHCWILYVIKNSFSVEFTTRSYLYIHMHAVITRTQTHTKKISYSQIHIDKHAHTYTHSMGKQTHEMCISMCLMLLIFPYSSSSSSSFWKPKCIRSEISKICQFKLFHSHSHLATIVLLTFFAQKPKEKRNSNHIRSCTQSSYDQNMPVLSKGVRCSCFTSFACSFHHYL